MIIKNIINIIEYKIRKEIIYIIRIIIKLIISIMIIEIMIK